MNAQPVRMGQLARSWNDAAKSITFCVTEDCNLACKYCYMTGKNARTTMPFEIARKAVDYILTDRDYFAEEAVVWEFIGGEPFLEIELIDRISDYIKQQMFLRGHPWFDAYRFNFSTNGLLYHTPAVQNYITKNKGHVSIGISVDGNRTKHDLQRVYRDGSGSFDRVLKNVPLWLSQMPGASTKATFAHDDLPHLKDSIVALWEMGIPMVAANVVFEDVWVDGDDAVFEDQLRRLADYVIDNRLYDDYSVRFFDPQVGNPLTEDDREANFCGTGHMLAIDCRGDFFPCIRFYDMSLAHQHGRRIGNVDTGIDPDRLRPFHALTLRSVSRPECVDCEVGKGCAWCSGANYDCADSETIFQRATFICAMHKANARANEYFWQRYADVTGRVSEKDKLRAAQSPPTAAPPRYLSILTSDTAAPHCRYRNTSGSTATMDAATFERSLAFCAEHGFEPVVLGVPEAGAAPGAAPYGGLAIVGADRAAEGLPPERVASARPSYLPVFDNGTSAAAPAASNAILLVDLAHLDELGAMAADLAGRHARLNLVLEEVPAWSPADLTRYEVQLRSVADLVRARHEAGSPIEVNVLTDLWYLTGMCGCGAGENSFTVAPNGKIYLCPAYYFADPQDSVGDLEAGLRVPNPQLHTAAGSPYCSACDVFSCQRCTFLNRATTGEVNIPSRMQCLVGHVERKVSMELQHALVGQGLLRPDNLLGPVWYDEPLQLVTARSGRRSTP